MPYKHTEDRRANHRRYMRAYRKALKGAAVAKLGKVQVLCERWTEDLGKQTASSPRNIKAARLLHEIKEILGVNEMGMSLDEIRNWTAEDWVNFEVLCHIYAQGYTERKAKDSDVPPNPHPEGSLTARVWDTGWMRADKDIAGEHIISTGA